MNGNANPPPTPPGPPQPPAANPFEGQLPAPRNFQVYALLENNQTIELRIQSRDHIGALVKLAGELNDQIPMRVLKIQFADVSGQRIIVPQGRG